VLNSYTNDVEQIAIVYQQMPVNAVNTPWQDRISSKALWKKAGEESNQCCSS